MHFLRWFIIYFWDLQPIYLYTDYNPFSKYPEHPSILNKQRGAKTIVTIFQFWFVTMGQEKTLEFDGLFITHPQDASCFSGNSGGVYTVITSTGLEALGRPVWNRNRHCPKSCQKRWNVRHSTKSAISWRISIDRSGFEFFPAKTTGLSFYHEERSHRKAIDWCIWCSGLLGLDSWHASKI